MSQYKEINRILKIATLATLLLGFLCLKSSAQSLIRTKRGSTSVLAADANLQAYQTFIIPLVVDTMATHTIFGGVDSLGMLIGVRGSSIKYYIRDSSAGTHKWTLVGAGGGSSTFAGLTDVLFSGLANGNLVKYNSGTSQWNNYTPGQSDVTGWLGYTPIPSGRLITINGQIFDLTADRTYTVTDVSLSMSDVTNNNASTTQHGFLLKLNNNALYYMDGTGHWSIPAGGGGSSTLASLTDVNLGVLSNLQFLVYNSGSAKWVNHTLVAADLPVAKADGSTLGVMTGDPIYFKDNGSGKFTVVPDTVRYLSPLVNTTHTPNGPDTVSCPSCATLSGQLIQSPVKYVTTAALAANTYNNGTSGVGATLTANANGALPSQDGQAVAINDRILVWNESTPSHNGIYTITQVGDGSHPYILTRAVYADVAANLSAGMRVYAQNGNIYGGHVFTQSVSGAITIGTTALVFFSDIIGTGTTNQVAYFNGLNSLKSEFGFEYDPSNYRWSFYNGSGGSAPTYSGANVSAISPIYDFGSFGGFNSYTSAGSFGIAGIITMGVGNAFSAPSNSVGMFSDAIWGQLNTLTATNNNLSWSLIGGYGNNIDGLSYSLVAGKRNVVNQYTAVSGDFIFGDSVSTSGASAPSWSSGIGQNLILKGVQRQFWFGKFNDTTAANIAMGLGYGTADGSRLNLWWIDSLGNQFLNPGARPGSPVEGEWHYNSSNHTFEGYNGSAWGAFGAGAGTPGGSNTQLQFNNSGAFGGISGVTTNGSDLEVNNGFARSGWQTITSGTTTTITSGTVASVLVNPASALASHTVTMPASPVDGQEITFVFGGTIAADSVVVTSFTVSPNSGQSIMDANAPIFAIGGTSISYKYKTSNTTWYLTHKMTGAFTQIFTNNSTWTLPPGAKSIHVICLSAGGAGGSGRKGAAGTDRSGGGGGSGGGISIADLDPRDVTSPVTITVPLAPAGGAAQTTNSTDGNPGADGLSASFGPYLRAYGGLHGAGGTQSTGVPGGNGNGTGLTYSGQTGGGGSNTTGVNAGNFTYGPTGGGGGGGLNAANSVGTYGFGGSYGVWSNPAQNWAAGFGSGATGLKVPGQYFGVGGNGGSASGTGNADAGGNGFWGAGGGGGGAAKDATGNSGAGGNGGQGVVIVITYF